MAGVRATTASLEGLNSENHVTAAKTVAERLFGAKAGPGVGSTRTAMGEISNVARGTRNAKGNDPMNHRPMRAITKRMDALWGSVKAQPVPVDTHGEDADMEVDSGSATAEGFSTENLCHFDVEDIDSGDAREPQLVADYVNEIYVYLRQMERRQSVRKDYLAGKVGAITPHMRTVLVEWLVEVHNQFSLLQETLYLSVAVLDRYLQVAAEKVPRDSLQLVGVCAMFIASKYEEMYLPEIGDFVYITDNAYTTDQIKETEIKIMSALKFDLGRPLPLHFLRRNSKAGRVDGTTHVLAKYVMELTLLEYKMAHVLPSEIAAAALAFSLKALDDEDKPWPELWNPTLEYYSQYQLKDIALTLQQVAFVVLNTSQAQPRSKLLFIRKKYSDKRFCKIAARPELTSQIVQDMAKGIF